MDNTTLFEKTSEYAKMVGADFYPSFILNDGIVVSGELERDINGDVKRVGFDFQVNELTIEQMALLIVAHGLRLFTITAPETKVNWFTMQPVKSAAISQIGHNGDTLRVKFNSGQTYDYPATVETFLELESAESIGKHFREHFGSAKGKLVE